VAYLNTYPRSLAKELKKHNRQHERKKVACCFSTVLKKMHDYLIRVQTFTAVVST